jgi:protein TonB
MGTDRGRYRPPVGLPDGDNTRGRWQGLIVSIALHALAVFLVLMSAVATGVIRVDARSLGIPSVLSRGGGRAAVRERLGYVAIEPAPPTTQRPKTLPRPVPVSVPILQPVTPVAPVSPDTTAGTGPPTGAGVGAGKGGGIGSGTGTHGSIGAAGSATATKIKASYVELPAVGLDAPRRVLPFHLVATFEIGPHGEARILSVTPTRDEDFNKRIRGELLEIRWRAAELPDGTPVSDTVQVSLDLD